MKKVASILLALAVICAMMSAFTLTASAEEEEATKPESATWLVDEGDDRVWYELTEDDSVLTIGGAGAMPDFTNSQKRPWNDAADTITAAVINPGVTSIGAYTFKDCTNLDRVTIPSGVTSIGENAFYSCKNLQSVNIPEGVESIGNSAFYSCKKLQSVTIPSGVTSIGTGAFAECGDLVAMTIPKSVKSIGDSAFYGCAKMETLTISDGVESIEMDAFANCGSLTTVTIPKSVKHIGEGAFSECANLVIHGISGSPAEQYAIKSGVSFIADDKNACKHLDRFVCDTCNRSVTRSELLGAWGGTATGSILSEGSLVIIVGVAAFVLGLGVMFFIMRKKRAR